MKKNEWHYNRDYRVNVSKADGVFIILAIIVVIIAIICIRNKKGYNDYDWDYEEYTIMYGDTVYAIEQEYYNTWCVGVKVSFQEYRYEVEKRSNVSNVNKVKQGDTIILPVNPRER